MKSLVVFLIAAFASSSAHALLCNPAQELCGFVKGQRTSGSPAKPSSSNNIRINPSAVPTNKMIGIEGLFYKGEVDVSLARGLGRIGAAISPSNSEETFFGPPGLESDIALLDRKRQAIKYPGQKVTLATAVNLYEKKGSGLSNISMNLGIMGKYHKYDGAVTPGGGVTLNIGPLNIGYAKYKDRHHLSMADYLLPDVYALVEYEVETISAGVFLGSLALDYSILQMYMPTDRWETRVGTASIFLKRGIFTIAVRSEDSSRSSYNYSLDTLSSARGKTESFLGAQLTAGSHFMIGAFYNYYMVREVSLAATLFF
ncbi:MAG: hypothetical protein V4760_08700 [Bdellovibrionota bacterium]